MFSEEETELRDIIIQNLEKSGFLNKIKAELRAGVCLAIEEEENLKRKIPLFNKKFDEFAATTEGKLMLSIVREFLEFFNFNYTLSVFDPEIAIDSPCLSRSEICTNLKLQSDLEGPVLSELIKDKLDVQNRKLTSESMSGGNEVQNTGFVFAQKNIPNEHYVNSKSILISSKPESNDMNNKKSKVKFGMDFSSKETKTFSDETVLDKLSNAVNINKDVIDKPNSLTSDHDPFFDAPLPSEKTSLFSFDEDYKTKSVLEALNARDKSAKSGLSSLRDLPSLSSSSEWRFKRPSLPSLESHKSASSSEASNEEIINLDNKDEELNKDLAFADSNDSSEKHNSEESIEEDIDDDDTAGIDDILNSLSLGDDATTDQTVSQTSVVEGVDHIELCKEVI